MVPWDNLPRDNMPWDNLPQDNLPWYNSPQRISALGDNKARILIAQETTRPEDNLTWHGEKYLLDNVSWRQPG